MGLLSTFFRPSTAAAEVRAEIWRLGGRHAGEPLKGAMAELKNPELPAARATLLRACVEKLRMQDR